MQNFYLATTELRDPYKPRECRVIKRLRNEFRDDLAWVEIMPSLPRETYDTNEDISQLILSAKHQGMSLFPVTEWPLSVYICWFKGSVDLHSGFIPSDVLTILDWGEIRKNP